MPCVVLPSFEEETCYHQCYYVIIFFKLVSLLVFKDVLFEVGDDVWLCRVT